MKNDAIAAILEHLCNEARNYAHATLGLMDLARGTTDDCGTRSSIAIGKSSADQLLRSLDDVRDLIASPPTAPGVAEQFDLTASVNEIVSMLNLASGRRARHMVLEGPVQWLPVSQDRKAVEQVITRVLDSAFKLTQTNEVQVVVSGERAENLARVSISFRDAQLSARMVQWLDTNPQEASFKNSDEVPFAVAVMLAGKYLRRLKGSAGLVRDAAGHFSLVLRMPAQAPGASPCDQPSQPEPDALNILIAEDCDESFALTEWMLENQNIRRARDGHEALRMVKKQRFDLIFMDVHMPGIDGYTAIRGMREWEMQTGNARTPIVILSSDDLETQRRSAARCGCSGFLRKPLDATDLTNLLDRVRLSRTPLA